MKGTLLLALGAGLALPALAAAQAISGITGGTLFTSFEGDGDTVGWSFRANESIRVVFLGFWDSTAAPYTPMTGSHEVGIWSDSGTLLGSATVTPSSLVVGDFKYAPLETAVVLQAGRTYTVGAYYPAANPASDGYVSSVTSFTTAPQVDHLGSAHDTAGAHASLAFPGVVTAGNGRFGPNFLFVSDPWAPGVATLEGGTLFTSFEGDGDTAGWSFRITEPILVTQLGFWDSTVAPFTAMTGSHEVGLWNDSGTLLGSATVTPSSALFGEFRYVSLSASLRLAPGTYMLGAYYPAGNPASDGYISSLASFTLPPQVQHLGAAHDTVGAHASLAFPGVVTAGNGRFGPNLRFMPNPGRLIAVDSSRALYELDMGTGARASIGTVSSNAGITAALARDPATGTVYLSSTSLDELFTLDLGTGNATLVGPYGGTSTVMHGLEFDSSTGTLYGGSNGNLFRINRTTGAATQVGTSGLTSFTNLGYNSYTDVLFATDSGTDSSYIVNRATGAMTLLGALNGPTGPSGLAFNPSDGRMYLVDNSTDSLYTISPSTGGAALIGSTGVGNLLGLVHIPEPAPCYANCDNSTTSPVLNVADFTCFLQKFAAVDPYANCDGSTQAPTLNVADFTCFLQKFAAGCP
jgi:hypothetical protein